MGPSYRRYPHDSPWRIPAVSSENHLTRPQFRSVRSGSYCHRKIRSGGSVIHYRPILPWGEKERPHFGVENGGKIMPILELKNVSKSFGEPEAVSKVSFELNEREIVGLIVPTAREDYDFQSHHRNISPGKRICALRRPRYHKAPLISPQPYRNREDLPGCAPF